MSAKTVATQEEDTFAMWLKKWTLHPSLYKNANYSHFVDILITQGKKITNLAAVSIKGAASSPLSLHSLDWSENLSVRHARTAHCSALWLFLRPLPLSPPSAPASSNLPVRFCSAASVKMFGQQVLVLSKYWRTCFNNLGLFSTTCSCFVTVCVPFSVEAALR